MKTKLFSTASDRFASAAVLLVSLIITALLFNHTRDLGIRASRDHFLFRVREAKLAIDQRMVGYKEILRGGVGLFDAATPVTREMFQIYVQNLQLEESFLGIQGVGFSIRIRPGELDDHIRQVRAEGFPQYTVHPPGERDEYTAIVYLEPFSGRNLRAFGFDMFSEPVRREAMARARDSGVPSASGAVRLVQETEVDIQTGFLLYLPVYRRNLPLESVEQRREALLGYVYSPFRMKDLMHGILGREFPAIRLEIFDGRSTADAPVMYSSEETRTNAASPLFTHTDVIFIEGRPWTLRFTSPPTFEEAIDHTDSWFVLGTGVVISGLLFGLTLALGRMRAHAAALAAEVRERNRVLEELRISQRQVHELNAELEQRVIERTRQLETTNKELEAFSYSVSHDLQAPLRAINGFAGALGEDYEHLFDDEGKRFLRAIRTNAYKMAQLINDLLSFSRITRKGFTKTPVDMTSLAQSVVDEIRSLEEDRKCEVILPALQPALGDPALLRQVWANLLANAFKFTKQTKQPRIEIGSHRTDRMTTYYVRDNGAGFDMKYVDKLFGVFQRLHSEEEFEGTGIGLAIVKRIIERHAGKVWAEGKTGAGASFYFSLPTED